jgi:hypothetical protein
MKTTTIYACYLPGSTTPDYIGSHASTPPPSSSALQWRYEQCTYLGQGCWIDKDGIIVTIPRNNRDTEWGKLLLLMSAAERLAIRIGTLALVEDADRWKTEAQLLRDHRPRFNALLPQTAEEKRVKWNAYCRINSKRYYTAHPDKAQAKRDKDRARIAAKRAAAKAAKDAANVA